MNTPSSQANQASHQAQDHNSTDTPTDADGTSASRRQRRFAVLGVTAGLLGGGAVGLLAATPSFSSAANNTSAVSAAVVEPTDDTATGTPADTATDDTTDPVDRPDPSVRLRESLQTLVDDGTITSEQADAVATHLGALRGDMRGGMGHHGGGGRFGRVRAELLSELLGIEPIEIRIALGGGSTVAELAEANGVDVQTVIDGLVAAANLRIDEAVADGRLTEEEAATKRAELVTRITESVNTVRPAGRHPG
jgi:polyhydroxyalkanoate synthesis regulator phasin